jgi:hypothetical protein
VAIACAATGNTLSGWLTLHPEHSAVAAVSILFMAAWVFHVLAPTRQRPIPVSTSGSDGEAEPESSARRQSRAAWLPYVSPAIVFTLLIYAQFTASSFERVSLAVLATLTAGLVLLRQILARRDLHSAQGELSHRALHDTLTELPNRTLILDRAGQMLARAKREKRPIAVLYLDIDHSSR